jgi:hypothetical protein
MAVAEKINHEQLDHDMAKQLDHELNVRKNEEACMPGEFTIEAGGGLSPDEPLF